MLKRPAGPAQPNVYTAAQVAEYQGLRQQMAGMDRLGAIELLRSRPDFASWHAQQATEAAP